MAFNPIAYANCEYCKEKINPEDNLSSKFTDETCSHSFAHITCIMHMYVNNEDVTCTICATRITTLSDDLVSLFHSQECPLCRKDSNFDRPTTDFYTDFNELLEFGNLSNIDPEEVEISMPVTFTDTNPQESVVIDAHNILTGQGQTQETQTTTSESQEENTSSSTLRAVTALIFMAIPIVYFALQFFASNYFI